MQPGAEPVDLALRAYAVITVLDVFLAWFQPDPARWPRRPTHLLTEPVQRPIRAVLRRVPTAGWDLSPLVVLLLVAAARAAWMRR